MTKFSDNAVRSYNLLGRFETLKKKHQYNYVGSNDPERDANRKAATVMMHEIHVMLKKLNDHMERGG